ncbi:MAG: ATP-binding protein [Deltaproteobacteria bacterium]|nr:ATP-binding protein [Deltaproteobacteria bacterium]
MSEITASTTEPAATEPCSTIDFHLRLGPLASAKGDVAAVLGESVLALLAMFYPSNIAKKANIVVTELVTNVFENILDPDSAFTLALHISPETLLIKVSNQVNAEVIEKLQTKVALLASVTDAKKLMVQTIRERRPHRLKGGLGLIRLVAENRFALSVSHTESGMITVSARYTIERSP